MKPSVGIIVVSDIHAGTDSPYAELRTSGGTPSPTSPHYSMQVLAAAIEKVVHEVPKTKRVLLCTGDLSAHCHSNEITAAAQSLTTLADLLKIPKSHRLLVPGNHDIDWPLTELANKDAWYDKYRQQKLSDQLQAHAPTFQCPMGGKPLEVRLLGDTLRFYLLDSAHEDRVQHEPHRGTIGSAQLDALEDLLAAPTEALRCVALHHHVAPFAPTHGLPDFSLLQDASDLLGKLRKYGVPLLFHGHQHVPFFQQLTVGGPPITIVSSGSTTAAYARLPQEVHNTFHVMTLVGLSQDRPRGVLHTRMFSITNGWQLPSRRFHNIGARRPFGATHQPTDLEAWAEEALTQCETAKLVPIDDFLAEKQDGNYCCAHDFGDLIRNKLLRRPNGEEFEVLCSDDDRLILTRRALI